MPAMSGPSASRRCLNPLALQDTSQHTTPNMPWRSVEPRRVELLRVCPRLCSDHRRSEAKAISQAPAKSSRPVNFLGVSHDFTRKIWVYQRVASRANHRCRCSEDSIKRKSIVKQLSDLFRHRCTEPGCSQQQHHTLWRSLLKFCHERTVDMQ